MKDNNIICCYRQGEQCAVVSGKANCPCVDYAESDPLIEMRKHQEKMLVMGYDPMKESESKFLKRIGFRPRKTQLSALLPLLISLILMLILLLTQ